MKTLSTFVIALSLAVLSSTAGAWGLLPPSSASTTEYYSDWKYHSEQYSAFNFWVKTCLFERTISSEPIYDGARLGNQVSHEPQLLRGVSSRTEYKSIIVSRAFNCRNARP